MIKTVTNAHYKQLESNGVISSKMASNSEFFNSACFLFFSRFMSSKCIFLKNMRKEITIPFFKTVCSFATRNFLMLCVSNPL